MIVNTRLRFVFVHIPKTAGTSVARALNRIPGRDRTAESHGTRHETYTEFRAAYAERTGRPVEEVDDFTVIAYVRDPVSRFLSLHRYLRAMHREKYPQVPDSPDEFARLLAEPFPDWMSSIRSLRPQSDFLPDARHRLLLGRYETLERDFEIVASRLGCNPRLPYLNATVPRDTGQGAQPGSVTKEILAQHYRRDFEAFGY